MFESSEGKKVLFGQDLHGPFQQEWGSDLDEWKHSIDLISSLQPDILCEGHYGIFKGNESVEKYIKEQLKSHGFS